MQSSSHPCDPYRTLLGAHGLRVTPQRIAVLQAIDTAKGHLTAEEIIVRIHVISPTIATATIYRTLEHLSKMGLLSQSRLADRQPVYELMGAPPHHHLLCESCGQIVEIDDAALAPLYQALQEQHQFTARAQHFIINGQCAACRAAAPVAPHSQ